HPPVAGNGQASLSWSAVTGATAYKLFQSVTEHIYGSEIATLAGTSYTADGLLNGTTYYYVVRAVNADALGAVSNQVSATPFTLPAAPRNVSAVAGDRRATISFDLPENDGGGAIIEYEVTASPGGSVTVGESSPILVTGLDNGTSYSFTVTARNLAGSSAPSSASNAVVPAEPTPPGHDDDDDSGDDGGSDDGGSDDGGSDDGGSDDGGSDDGGSDDGGSDDGGSDDGGSDDGGSDDGGIDD